MSGLCCFLDKITLTFIHEESNSLIYLSLQLRVIAPLWDVPVYISVSRNFSPLLNYVAIILFSYDILYQLSQPLTLFLHLHYINLFFCTDPLTWETQSVHKLNKALSWNITVLPRERSSLWESGSLILCRGYHCNDGDQNPK